MAFIESILSRGRDTVRAANRGDANSQVELGSFHSMSALRLGILQGAPADDHTVAARWAEALMFNEMAAEKGGPVLRNAPVTGGVDDAAMFLRTRDTFLCGQLQEPQCLCPSRFKHVIVSRRSLQNIRPRRTGRRAGSRRCFGRPRKIRREPRAGTPPGWHLKRQTLKPVFLLDRC
jgi:hypothetical protein